VCQFVDDDEVRSTFEEGVDVHLLDHMTLALDLSARDKLEPAKLFFGISPPMSFD